MPHSSFRRDWITKPIFRMAQHALPQPLRHRARSHRGRRRLVGRRPVHRQSRLEQASGLRAGQACRTRSSNFSPARSKSSAACSTTGRSIGSVHDLPPEVWDFLKAHKFFAMIIPKQYGGLGFSAYAHSEVIRKLSSRSICARRHRDGAELARPRRAADAIRHQRSRITGCRGSRAARKSRASVSPVPEAGSDAASMIDSGVVCRGTYEGREAARHPAQLAQALHHARPDRDGAGACFQAARSRSPDRRPRRHRHHAGAGADPSARRQHRPAPSAGDARLPERAELGPRRLHPHGSMSSAASTRSARAGRC